MANAITLFKKYIALLDEVYKEASLTSPLDSDASLIRQGANANELIIPKMSMDALADYSRSGGYVAGDVTLTNETVSYNYDRGRSFTVDAMDNEETAGIAFGKLASEFIRTKVVPELDAFRFATYASADNTTAATAATLSSGADVVTALRSATNAMDEGEVPMENRVLFITPGLMGLVQDMDLTKSNEVLNRFQTVVMVPQTRFYTAITLNDGKTSGQTAGGYAKGEAAKDINFMVIHPSAVLQYSKHTVNKVFAPEENQNADGWKFVFRSYGLAEVYENKVSGIYLHNKA